MPSDTELLCIKLHWGEISMTLQSQQLHSVAHEKVLCFRHKTNQPVRMWHLTGFIKKPVTILP